MINSIRGFRDIFSPESDAFYEIEKAARELLSLYNYKELRTPSVELKELFIKSTGETTDIVEKEMYAFSDAKGRELALRPEGTPGVARAYLESSAYNDNPRRKYFYIGKMFRAERPQKGRYREFEQLGVEYLGNPDASADAEVIILLNNLFKKCGINNFDIEINSLGCKVCRPAYRDALHKFLNENTGLLCDMCLSRKDRNPLRVLDCKTDGPKLKEIAPKMQLCQECESHNDSLKVHLTNQGINFRENKNLVRGLDYYSKTVFEFLSGELGAQNAIGAGGRYDSLIESMGGPSIPAVGWAIGADRAVSLLKQQEEKNPLVFGIAFGDKAKPAVFSLLQELRNNGISSDSGNFSQNFKAQMKAADKAKAKYAVLAGEDELAKNVFTLKNMLTGKQQEMPKDKLIEFLKNNAA